MNDEQELKDEKKRQAGTKESKTEKQKVATQLESVETAWFEKLPAEIWTEIFSKLKLKKILELRSVSHPFKALVDDKNTLIDNALRRRAKELVKIARSLGEVSEIIKNLDIAIGYLEKIANKKDQDYQDNFDCRYEKVDYLLNNATIIDRNDLSAAFRTIPGKQCIDFFYAAPNERELGKLYVKENNLPQALCCFHENLNYLFQYTFSYLIFENNFLVEDTRFLYGADFEFFIHHPFDNMESHIYALMYTWVSIQNANMKNLVNSFSDFKLKDIKNSTLLLHLYEFILYVFSIDEETVNDENLDNAHIFQAFQKDEDSQKKFGEILAELESLIDKEQLQTRYSWQYSQKYLIDQETEDETTSMTCD